jgi:hypothetical protein
MNTKNKRQHERVETNIKIKLPDEASWTECTTSNVSGSGLFFDAQRQLSVGEFIVLQFMLQSKSGTTSNVHFFALAQIVRVIPKSDIYQTAIEFIVDEALQKEILRHVNIIKSQSPRLDRPTIDHVLFRR